jgi:hypothetical protein
VLGNSSRASVVPMLWWRPGAFHEVRVLPNGSAWLQATSTLEGYRGRAVRRVFEALAPVLLPGKVEQPVGGPPWEQLVMGVDAADYR